MSGAQLRFRGQRGRLDRLARSGHRGVKRMVEWLGEVWVCTSLRDLCSHRGAGHSHERLIRWANNKSKGPGGQTADGGGGQGSTGNHFNVR